MLCSFPVQWISTCSYSLTEPTPSKNQNFSNSPIFANFNCTHIPLTDTKTASYICSYT